jgi:hypothetical protein
MRIKTKEVYRPKVLLAFATAAREYVRMLQPFWRCASCVSLVLKRQ